MASPPLVLPAPSPPHGPDFEDLLFLAREGDFAVLRQSSIEHPANVTYWNTSHGLFVLRAIAVGAARVKQWAIVLYMCERCGVAVNALPAEEGGLWLVPGIPAEDMPNTNLMLTPLVGAISGGHEDLALYLLTLPDQELKLNRRLADGHSILHLCAVRGMTRLLKELVQRGADMDSSDHSQHTPLCLAACNGYLRIVRFLLEQYQAGGRWI